MRTKVDALYDLAKKVNGEASRDEPLVIEDDEDIEALEKLYTDFNADVNAYPDAVLFAPDEDTNYIYTVSKVIMEYGQFFMLINGGTGFVSDSHSDWTASIYYKLEREDENVCSFSMIAVPDSSGE